MHLNNKEYVTAVSKFLDEVIPQLGKCCVDIGNLNELAMATTAKMKEWRPDSHWDNHEDYPTEDWTDEVCEGNTRQSYIEWVNSQIED